MLFKVICEIHLGHTPTKSQHHSVMVFANKPKKIDSTSPSDKRHISLLNSDMKILSGLESMRLQSTTQHTLSPSQLVTGNDQRIQHGINSARDSILFADKNKLDGGLLSLDFKQGFDHLTMSFVFKVLVKKGLHKDVIDHLKRIYKDNTTSVCINNVLGNPILNIRLSLRQGDVPSMIFFCFGIDPLLHSLNHSLTGITRLSVPTFGPLNVHQISPSVISDILKLISYADDLNPFVRSLEEITHIINECTFLELASGVQLHRDPGSGKVKIFLLGNWRDNITQENIPFPFIKVSPFLEVVGVQLYNNAHFTRKMNSELLVTKVSKIINLWKSGHHMSFLDHSHAINALVLSKVWYIASCVPPRQGDIQKIVTSIKSFLYQDQFLRPSDLVAYRSTEHGGLGLTHTLSRCQALIIKSFLETSIIPGYRWSLTNTELFNQHVLDLPPRFNVPFSLFHSPSFFNLIKSVKSASIIELQKMSLKQIYTTLTDLNVRKDMQGQLIPLHIETKLPWVDWEVVWKCIRLKGLDGNCISTTYLSILNTLPTSERQARINPGKSNLCRFCPNVVEDIHHIFADCQSSEAASFLLSVIRHFQPDISFTEILLLQWVWKEHLFPLTWLTSSVFEIIWINRNSGI